MILHSSHPSSANYGKHWSIEDVTVTFAPSDETVSAVREWLVNIGGITNDRIVQSDNEAWLAFDATVKQAESLLHAEYNHYEHTNSGNSYAACEEYHLPKYIQGHIDYITPGVKAVQISDPSPVTTERGPFKPSKFVRERKRGFGKLATGKQYLPPNIRPATPMPKYLRNETANCDVAITPVCIQALYQVPPPDPNRTVSPNNSLGIFEEGDFYSQADLDLFFANFTPYIPAGTHPIPNFIDGANAPVPVTQAGGESDLDFQLAYPIIYPQTTTLYQTDDLFYSNSPNSTATGIFNTFLDALDGVSSRH